MSVNKIIRFLRKIMKRRKENLEDTLNKKNSHSNTNMN